MSGNKLENIRVAALVTDGFEQIEFTSPRDALTSELAIVHVLAPTERDESHCVRGWNHLHRGDEFYVDSTIEEANPEDYDAVLLPGGVVGADRLRTNEAAQAFLRDINDADKPIFSICHAPWTLVSAGLVRGRTMTSYKSLQDDLVNAGARWVDEPVVVDENFVSSRHPGDLPEFNRTIVEKLASLQKAHASRDYQE